MRASASFAIQTWATPPVPFDRRPGGPKAGLYAAERRKIPTAAGYRTPVVQPIVQNYQLDIYTLPGHLEDAPFLGEKNRRNII
jgi:hypothetical protein